MTAKYELWLTDDAGLRIADSRGRSCLKSFISLSASRAINQIGNFVLELPKTFDASLLSPDRMVQVWRAPTGGRLALWRVYFILAGFSEHAAVMRALLFMAQIPTIYYAVASWPLTLAAPRPQKPTVPTI